MSRRLSPRCIFLFPFFFSCTSLFTVVQLNLSSFNIFQTSMQYDTALFSSDAEVQDIYNFKGEHLFWIQEQRKAALNLSLHEEPMLIYHRLMAGLGHSFTRIACTYHLAKLYKIPRIYPTSNPVCGGDIFTIYDHLIGQGPLIVDLPFSTLGRETELPNIFPNLTWVNTANMTAEALASIKRAPMINNEPPGYSVVTNLGKSNLAKMYDQNYGKNVTDYEVYQQLMLLFQQKHHDRIQKVLNVTRFKDHTVFALHVRTGNGEKGDFTIKGRGVRDLEKWIQNVMILLCDYSKSNANYFVEKPLMIFVGTDTGSVVPKLQNASQKMCKIPVVSAAQKYPEEGKSVSFQEKHKEQAKCLESWESMFLDMYFFTQSNSVIAGMYSSFTQSAPLSYTFQKAKHNQELSRSNNPHYFCEIGEKGDYMECFDNFRSWIISEHKYSLGNTTNNKTFRTLEVLFPYQVESDMLTLSASEILSFFSSEILTLFAGTVLRPP